MADFERLPFQGENCKDETTAFVLSRQNNEIAASSQKQLQETNADSSKMPKKVVQPSTVAVRDTSAQRKYFYDASGAVGRALKSVFENTMRTSNAHASGENFKIDFFPSMRFLYYENNGFVGPHTDLTKTVEGRTSTHTFILYLTDSGEQSEQEQGTSVGGQREYDGDTVLLRHLLCTYTTLREKKWV